MYKKIIRLFLIMIVINTAWVMGKEGSRSSGDERSIIDRAEITTCNCGMTHRLGVHVGRDGERTITDTISYYTDPSYVEDYSDFMSGYQSTGDDSVVTRIHLLTAGVINQFHVMTRNLNPDGVVVDDYAPVDTWVYGPAYQQDDEGLWHAQYPSMGNTYDGAMESSLQLLMPYTIPTVFSNSDPENHFNAQGEWDPWAATSGGWNVFDFPTWTLDGLGINVVSDSLGVPDEMLYVYVGYNMVSTDVGGSVVENIATIWQDGTPDPTDNWSCRSTIHSISPEGGSWYGIWNGEFPYHHLTQAVVQYEAVPPFVEQLPNFSDTWAEEKEVWADVIDLDGDAFACTLNVTIAPEGGNPYDQEIAMMQDSEVEGRYIANVTMAVGDTVNFYIRATDVTGRSSTSSWRSFVRVSAPTPSQHVLVLQDGTRDSLGGTWGSIYTSGTGLNPLFGSTGYYVWNVNDHSGVDYDVINHPNFDLIVKHGWAGGAMPSTGEDIYGFGDFLNGGGRLLYSDMDYFWKTDLGNEGSFSEGDFAYDYLGLSYYWNDPDNDGDGTNGGSGDLNHFGIDNDPITSPWENSAYGPLDYELVGWTNWGDFMTVELADHVFIGDQSYNKTGSRYNGLGFDAPFKTVYFSFPIEAAEDFTTLLSNSVDWLMGYGGPTGTIAQATPQDGETVDLSATGQLTFIFGGSVSDPDGDLIGYKIVLEGDLADLEIPASDGVSASVSAADVTAMIGENQSLTGTWKVVASDGLESIESGTRSLTVITGTLSSKEEVFPKQFTLMGNYPNPFNPDTQIRIEIPISANVTIIIRDILGREISRLGNEVYSPGLHSFGWDGKNYSGNNVPSGVYVYEVVATEVSTGNQLYRATDKMILMK
jgi:hypothetical protein